MNCDIGMIGLGVMGHNLVLNIAEHEFSVAGYDRDPEKNAAMRNEAKANVTVAGDLPALVEALRPPRAVMMLVPAGPPVDAVIRDLLPQLAPDDIIIDAGNSHFTDTNIRAKMLADKGLRFLGVGISGGEEGARCGPSIMPGGPRDAYERVRPVFEAVAAHVNGAPCVTYLGPGSAGHYVKMVHNGIEYALMQLIAETYDIMKRGPGMSNDEMHDVYEGWCRTEVNGFLLDITTRIFEHVDSFTGKRLIDVILDAARQKGTGKWTSQDAMENNVPVPSIDAGVAARDISAMENLRREISARLPTGDGSPATIEREALLASLHHALYAGMIVSFAQGMHLQATSSRLYGYDLQLDAIARIWQGGCIIRTALLEPIRQAYQAQPDLPHLFLDETLAKALAGCQQGLRTTVCFAAHRGIPVPGMMAALGYYDAFRSASLPANLIQAQRDYFGAHTYERIDRKGAFHTHWGIANGQ